MKGSVANVVLNSKPSPARQVQIQMVMHPLSRELDGASIEFLSNILGHIRMKITR